MQRVVGIVSGKGGVGKTTIAVNLGIALHRMGKNVLLVDGDITGANLGLHLGFYQFPLGIMEALDENLEPVDVVYTHQSGLSFIPGSLSMDYIGESVSSSKLRRFLDGIDSLVLLDAPPGLGKDSLTVMKACDEFMLVVNPDLPSVVDSMKLVQHAAEEGKRITGMILNRVKGKNEIVQQEIQQIIQSPVIGVVPEDAAVRKSLYYRTPVLLHDPFSPASISINSIASGIAGIPYKRPRLARMRRLFRR